MGVKSHAVSIISSCLVVYLTCAHLIGGMILQHQCSTLIFFIIMCIFWSALSNHY